MENIIKKTLKLLSEYEIHENNSLYKDLLNRLEEGFKKNKKSYYSCWGGEVWDQLYHYYGEKYNRILVANYDERKNSFRPLSAVMNDFPYDELNQICKENLI